MTGHLTHEWADFYIAAAGAAAAMAGLVIVAISVNINRILEYSHLPSRAGAAISSLILILVCSMATLIPQSFAVLGAEIVVLGVCAWALQVGSARKGVAARVQLGRRRSESVLDVVLGEIQTVPFVVGGVLLMLKHDSGLYWMAGGVIAIFIFSVLNAWVLLVEILR